MRVRLLHGPRGDACGANGMTRAYSIYRMRAVKSLRLTGSNPVTRRLTANRIGITQTGSRMTNPFLPAAPAPQADPYANPHTPGGNPFAAPVSVSVAAPAAYAPPVAAPVTGAAPPTLDMGRLASAPAPVVGEGRGAALPDMYGRLVLFFPFSIARVPRNPSFITAEQRQRGDVEQDRLTATIVVLDDGRGGQQPIAYGGKPYSIPATPHTDSAPLPYVRKGMWINQSRLISQLRDSLPATPGAAPGMIAGRVTKVGPNQNDPWFLIGATETEVALVRQYLEVVQAGQVPHPLA